ncbi:NADH-quinone oxidoreductase subunit H [Escherichia coli]|nr:NADH-quinone oxidoreductase subunit H [Escherichia coli]
MNYSTQVSTKGIFGLNVLQHVNFRIYVFIIIQIVLFLVLVIFSLVAVAFYTLIERRVLGNFHLRIGPFMVGPMGYFQSFRDAIKLFVKRDLVLRFNLNFI